MSELSVLADLLRLASDEFGNHGCNDYEIPNTPENYAIVQNALNAWNGGECYGEKPEVSTDGKKILTSDFFLMDYFSYWCRMKDASEHTGITTEEYENRKSWLSSLREDEPCDHPGCLSHVTHPCESCGRTAGRRQ